MLGAKLAELSSMKGHEVFAAYQVHLPEFGKPILIDQTDEKQVRRSVAQIRPQVILNTAALTDVDVCEEHPESALLINASSVGYLANAAKESNSFLVQVSTDYVFNGETGLYSETDVPNPVNQYGLSKLKGEQAAMSLSEGRWCVARASVVYGWGRSHRPNAATYVIEKLSRGENIQMVHDQFSSPTLNSNLAAMLLEIAEQKTQGLLHTSGFTRLSRYDFAIGLAETMGLNKRLISPIGRNELKWKAKRPRDSSLKVAKARNILSQGPLPIEVAYQLFCEESKHHAQPVPR